MSNPDTLTRSGEHPRLTQTDVCVQMATPMTRTVTVGPAPDVGFQDGIRTDALATRDGRNLGAKRGRDVRTARRTETAGDDRIEPPHVRPRDRTLHPALRAARLTTPSDRQIRTVLIVTLFLRWVARQLVGPAARPKDVVHADTGESDRILTSHRYRLTGQPRISPPPLGFLGALALG